MSFLLFLFQVIPCRPRLAIHTIAPVDSYSLHFPLRQTATSRSASTFYPPYFTLPNWESCSFRHRRCSLAPGRCHSNVQGSAGPPEGCTVPGHDHESGILGFSGEGPSASLKLIIQICLFSPFGPYSSIQEYGQLLSQLIAAASTTSLHTSPFYLHLARRWEPM